jgi:signal transduction histidine kinase
MATIRRDLAMTRRIQPSSPPGHDEPSRFVVGVETHMAEPEFVTILNVDDSAPGLLARSRVLRQAGFTVLEAATGAEALRLVTAHEPALVLLDVTMPDKSELELCRRLKANPAAAVLVLHVAATAARDPLRALECGADMYLVEPVETEELVASVRALLRLREAETALRARDRQLHAVPGEQNARHGAEPTNQAHDEFLATLSHVLRTPISAILGWAQVLTTVQADEATRRRALESIERNAREQVQLIDDMLDLSRMGAGTLRLQMHAVQLGPVIRAALETLQASAQAKDIQVGSHLEAGPSVVMGDPDRLRQVFWNLLSNAVKFTPRGGRVEVRQGRTDSRVEVHVVDNGVGIAREVLPVIFDRFRQSDVTASRAYGGLGLGLAIVRRLVELQGGAVSASSAGQGRGATFTVTLPLASRL